jgi:hypothetical protein
MHLLNTPRSFPLQYFTPYDESNLIFELDCFQASVFNALITDKNYSKEDSEIFDLFVSDLTFGIEMDMQENLLNLFFFPSSVHEKYFQDHIAFQITKCDKYTIESVVKTQVGNGRAVIVITCTELLPFYKYYTGDNNVPRVEPKSFKDKHAFLIIGCDAEHFYYVEAPFNLNTNTYVAYSENQTIGMLKKADADLAFDTFLYYCYLTYSDLNDYDTFELLRLAIAKSIENYDNPSEADNKTKRIFGKKALMELMNYFQKDDFCAPGNKVNNTNESLYFQWKLREISRRRTIFLYSLQKHQHHFDPLVVEELIGNLKEIIRKWKLLVMIINKLFFRISDQILIQARESLAQCVALEDRLIRTLRKIN